MALTNAQRIISVLLSRSGLDDDEIAERLEIRRQTVNQECRFLETRGILARGIGPRGKIVNNLTVGEDALRQEGWIV